MAKKAIKTYSLTEMKDKYIGKVGNANRDEYEYELRMDVLGKMIKSARQERHLTQEELGNLIGVQKAQISKLESSANSATIDTILKACNNPSITTSSYCSLSSRASCYRKETQGWVLIEAVQQHESTAELNFCKALNALLDKMQITH